MRMCFCCLFCFAFFSHNKIHQANPNVSQTNSHSFIIQLYVCSKWPSLCASNSNNINNFLYSYLMPTFSWCVGAKLCLWCTCACVQRKDKNPNGTQSSISLGKLLEKSERLWSNSVCKCSAKYHGTIWPYILCSVLLQFILFFFFWFFLLFNTVIFVFAFVLLFSTKKDSFYLPCPL